MQNFIQKVFDLLRGSSKRRLGDKARDAKNWLAAADLYRDHLALQPRDFAIWVQLGHAEKEAGNLDHAREAYAQAYNINDVNADLLLHFGRLLKLQGDSKTAVNYLSRSYHLDGNMHAKAEIDLILGYVSHDLHWHRDDVDDKDEQGKILNSGFFDPNWYIEKYPDIRDLSPLQHFCRHGAYEWRSPGPNFDTEWYLLQNPDLVAGVNGRLVNPLVHFLDYGRLEGRSALPVPGAHQVIQDLVENIFDLDPEIYAVDTYATPLKIKSLPILDGLIKSEAYSSFKRVFAALEKPYDYIVTVPWLRHGGADLVAMHISRAICELSSRGSVLLVACDYTIVEALDWLPDAVDIVVLQDEHRPLALAARVEALGFLIQSVRPLAVINVNSQTCWELFKTKGRALAQITRMYGCAFCRDYSPDNRASGYADTHMLETIPWLSGLISDNSKFLEELAVHFGFPKSLRSRFITLYNPILPTIAGTEKKAKPSQGVDQYETKSRFKVLWASRLEKQKNIDLLRKVVSAAPDLDFEVWGRGSGEQSVLRWSDELPNLTFKGSFASFGHLPASDYGAFLYTSLWDGIPNVLLEAAGAGLPIVASDVGGIGELVDDETGWLIHNIRDPDNYIASLRQIRDDAQMRTTRSQGMQDRLSHRHSWAQFKRTLAETILMETHS